MTRYINNGCLQVLPASDPAAPPPSEWDADLRSAEDGTLGADETRQWLPSESNVTVGYVAGHESANRGEEMVVRGPTEDVVEVLARAGYAVDGPLDSRMSQ